MINKEDMIEIKTLMWDFDSVATVTNKTGAKLTISFDDSEYEIPPIEIEPNGCYDLSHDENGRLMLEYLENGRYEIDDNGYFLRKALIETAENLGWTVYEDDDGGIDFRKYSPAGEDFGVYVHHDQDIVSEIRDCYLNFDKDEHVEMWLEAKGNKVAGVPSARELVQDAEDIEEMLEELSDAFAEVENTGEAFDPTAEKPETSYSLRESTSWTKEEFKEYLREEYDIAPEAHRLISNILDYVAVQGLGEDEQYMLLCNLLDCTIGLSDEEIKKICL